MANDGLWAPLTPGPVLLYSAKRIWSVFGVAELHSDQTALLSWIRMLSFSRQVIRMVEMFTCDPMYVLLKTTLEGNDQDWVQEGMDFV